MRLKIFVLFEPPLSRRPNGLVRDFLLPGLAPFYLTDQLLHIQELLHREFFLCPLGLAGWAVTGSYIN